MTRLIISPKTAAAEAEGQLPKNFEIGRLCSASVIICIIVETLNLQIPEVSSPYWWVRYILPYYQSTLFQQLRWQDLKWKAGVLQRWGNWLPCWRTLIWDASLSQWPIIPFLSPSAPLPFNTIRARVLATGRPYTVTLKIPQVSPPYWWVRYYHYHIIDRPFFDSCVDSNSNSIFLSPFALNC